MAAMLMTMNTYRNFLTFFICYSSFLKEFRPDARIDVIWRLLHSPMKAIITPVGPYVQVDRSIILRIDIALLSNHSDFMMFCVRVMLTIPPQIRLISIVRHN